jgi:hypothetical protein
VRSGAFDRQASRGFRDLGQRCLLSIRILVSRLRASRHNSQTGHGVTLRCPSFKYARYSRSLRLATRAPRPRLMPRSTETGH